MSGIAGPSFRHHAKPQRRSLRLLASMFFLLLATTLGAGGLFIRSNVTYAFQFGHVTWKTNEWDWFCTVGCGGTLAYVSCWELPTDASSTSSRRWRNSFVDVGVGIYARPSSPTDYRRTVNAMISSDIPLVASLLLLLYPIFALLRGPFRRWNRRRHGRCMDCDYDLTGNTTGICPECGAPISNPPIQKKEPANCV